MKFPSLHSVAWVLTASLLVGLPHTPRAQGIIVIGTRSGKAVEPFGISAAGTSFYTGQFQQVYAASAFPGPVLLSGIAFSQSNPGPLTANYDLAIGLGITAKSPASPGPGFVPGAVTVYSGSLAPVFTPATDDFDLVINFALPFHYDPSQGNLFLDVMLASGTGDNGVVALDSSASTMGRLWTEGHSVIVHPNSGLVTAFTVVPEPSCVALLCCGGLLLAANMRHGTNALRRISVRITR